jgi:3-dehydroquinate synthase
MFATLQKYSLAHFQNHEDSIAALLRKNVLLKAGMVQQDELEKDRRKLLNFGHTLAHAIENNYQLPHGHAVAIGMIFAARLSEREAGFQQTESIIRLLDRYGLPIHFDFNQSNALSTLMADKKRKQDVIDFILLAKIGSAIIKPLTLSVIKSGFDLL